MAWKKTPPEVVSAFEKARPKDPRVEARQMFGFPAIFVNGNLIGGTFEDRIMVRLSDSEIARLLEAGKATGFEPMKGRAMKGYVTVPASWLREPDAARTWITRSLEWSRELPAKEPRRRRS